MLLNMLRKCYNYSIYLNRGDQMAIYYSGKEMMFQNHPMFKGVEIAKLAGRDDGSPVGSSILKIGNGTEIPVHIHEQSIDSIFCVKGSGEIFRDGKWQPLRQGDYCLVPAGEEHGVRNSSGELLELFIIHCPPLF